MNENNKRILTSKMDQKVLNRFDNKPKDLSLNKIKKPEIFINRAATKMEEIDKAKENEKLYLDGVDNLGNENFDNAIEIFKEINNYKDSKELLNKALLGKEKLDKEQKRINRKERLKLIGKAVLYYSCLFGPVLLYILIVVLSGVYYKKLQVFSHSYAFLICSILFIVIYFVSFLLVAYYIGGTSKPKSKKCRRSFIGVNLLASFALVISFFATSSRVFTFEPNNVDISLVNKRYESNKTILMFKLTNNSNAEIIHTDFCIHLYADGALIEFLSNGYFLDHEYVTTYKNCSPQQTIYFEDEIKTSNSLNDTPFSRLSAKIYQLHIRYDSYIDNWVTFNDPDFRVIKEAD